MPSGTSRDSYGGIRRSLVTLPRLEGCTLEEGHHVHWSGPAGWCESGMVYKCRALGSPLLSESVRHCIGSTQCVVGFNLPYACKHCRLRPGLQPSGRQPHCSPDIACPGLRRRCGPGRSQFGTFSVHMIQHMSGASRARADHAPWQQVFSVSALCTQQ